MNPWIKRYCLMTILGLMRLNAISFNLQKTHPAPPNAMTYQIGITLNPGEYLYADTIAISTNHPQADIQEWHIQTPPTEQYDKQFNTNKKVFAQSTMLTATISEAPSTAQASLVINYLTNQQTAPQFTFIPLSTPAATQATAQVQKQSTPSNTPLCPEPAVTTCSPQQQQTTTLNVWAQHLFSLTSSWWLRLLLALLLGMLMSLTPCVYPMIPITIGILHAHKAASWRKHIALAISYMLGVASMFATLGLSAAVTGSLFGSLTGKPVVIIIIVAILGYFALSLFGLYQLRLPSILTKPHAQRPTGSFISAFLFGFASGTIASPCLSPGLAFLLSIVATLHSTLYGFFLLFMFGVGMSIPLIAIAASSTALTFMPRAGMWMIEIQKIFGILLIALCFYYLSNILSLIILLVLMGTALFILGVYYLLSSKHYQQPLKTFYRFMGASALALAVFLYYKAIDYTHQPLTPCPIAWQTDYEPARTIALKTHTILFVDFGAPYCSICKAIDRCLLHDTLIAPLLNQMICVKIDASQPSTQALSKQFNIIGVPTLLMINPQSQQVMRRWGAELYSVEHEEFAKQLSELLVYSSKLSFGS